MCMVKAAAYGGGWTVGANWASVVYKRCSPYRKSVHVLSTGVSHNKATFFTLEEKKVRVE